ncbi:hypothetical protein [Mycobacterium asiaticum]|nr:hypothetical protein [Mycobacterium asiaticum]
MTVPDFAFARHGRDDSAVDTIAPPDIAIVGGVCDGSAQRP